MTFSRLKHQAMPRPSAGHCTHQWPGEVIRLMMTRNSRISGAVNRNLTARSVSTIVGIL
jgi:hypothetical protein